MEDAQLVRLLDAERGSAERGTGGVGHRDRLPVEPDIGKLGVEIVDALVEAGCHLFQ